MGAPGMNNRQEESKEGNPNPGPRRREPDTEETRALAWSTRSLPEARSAGGPAREGLVEVIGEQPSRTRVKRRKADTAGKSARSNEAQNPLVAVDVLATRWELGLLFLPREICRVPRER